MRASRLGIGTTKKTWDGPRAWPWRGKRVHIAGIAKNSTNQCRFTTNLWKTVKKTPRWGPCRDQKQQTVRRGGGMGQKKGGGGGGGPYRSVACKPVQNSRGAWAFRRRSSRPNMIKRQEKAQPENGIKVVAAQSAGATSREPKNKGTFFSISWPATVVGGTGNGQR